MNLLILTAVIQTALGVETNDQGSDIEQPLLRAERAILSSKRYLWDKGVIPYTFHSSLPNNRKQEYLDKVFPVYEKYSCLNFVPWDGTTNEKKQLGHKNYLIFVQTRVCMSKIGNTRVNGQRISCCYWYTCLHEVGHALGLTHEHTSPLRNMFARIETGNIKEIARSQFAISNNVNTYGTYDLDSIMHYPVKAWSIDKSRPTITFLDPDTRPVSKFANTERYYYLFMQINKAYDCAAGCNLDCTHGGYAFRATVNGKCTCRCPEGLDPKNSCRSLLKKDYKCGDIIKLNDETPNVEIKSPKIRNEKKTATCYWFIKSPEKTRIILTFPTFDVRDDDEVAVRPYLLGMHGRSYTGKEFKKTVQSDSNVIGFSFTQTPSSNKISEFVAKASFVHEDDFCYNLTNGGVHYNGKVQVAADSSRCLSWDSVKDCKHHLYNIHDADKNLESNYCRNPDGTKGPWCYIKKDGCIRNYCNACQYGNYGKCKDIVFSCKKRIQNWPSYCKWDENASRDCRKTCGFCSLPSISKTFCVSPPLPSDAKPQTFDRTRFPVGEKIVVECNTNADFREITCLSDGSWTQLKYVCGTCRSGWTNFRSKCYKLFDELRTQSIADQTCKEQCEGCSLLRVNTWNRDFIQELIKTNIGGCKPVWLDLTNADDWQNGNQPCVAISSACTLVEKGCNGKTKFVCQYNRSDPSVCRDQRNDCKKYSDMCKSEKMFAQSYCAKTCGLC